MCGSTLEARVSLRCVFWQLVEQPAPTTRTSAQKCVHFTGATEAHRLDIMHTRYRDHTRRGNSANSMHGVAVVPFVVQFVVPCVDALDDVLALASTFAFAYAGNA